MRCQSCGRQAVVGVVKCATCGEPLRPVVALADRPTSTLPTEWPGDALDQQERALSPRSSTASILDRSVSARTQGDLTPVIAAGPLAPNARRDRLTRPVVTPTAVISPRPASQVHGRVILMEGPVSEPAGFDVILLLCQGLWLGLILIVPLLVLRMVVSSLIAAPSLIILLAIAFFLGILSPRHLLQAISTIFRMGQWGRTGGQTVPVRYLRIRDLEDDSEAIVRVAGYLPAANVLVDDIVLFHGWRRRGVLYATRGHNLRTNSRIHLRKQGSWLLLAVTLLIYAVLFAVFIALSRGSNLPGAT